MAKPKHPPGCRTWQEVLQKYRREYRTWSGMVRRCYDPKEIGFSRYGGRGIKVCKRWRMSFAAFLTDMGLRPAKHTIDRENNDGNYEPSNCRWILHKHNLRNKRNNRRITINGETKCVTDWAESSSIPRKILYGRLNRGWKPEEVLTLKPWPPLYAYQGRTFTLSNWSKILNKPAQVLWQRIQRYKWSIEDAFEKEVIKRKR